MPGVTASAQPPMLRTPRSALTSDPQIAFWCDALMMSGGCGAKIRYSPKTRRGTSAITGP